MRSSVSMVMRLPSRKRCTSLPSLTARRPKVDSAISAWRQYCEIWLRIWSFFIGKDLGQAGGQRRMVGLSYHHLPTLGNAGADPHSVSCAGFRLRQGFGGLTPKTRRSLGLDG